MYFFFSCLFRQIRFDVNRILVFINKQTKYGAISINKYVVSRLGRSMVGVSHTTMESILFSFAIDRGD